MAEPTVKTQDARREEPKTCRYVRWQTIYRDLPDITEDIADDIFWSSVAYRDFKPETERFLADRGVRGVLWP
jgi:hypothetical protein